MCLTVCVCRCTAMCLTVCVRMCTAMCLTVCVCRCIVMCLTVCVCRCTVMCLTVYVCTCIVMCLTVYVHRCTAMCLTVCVCRCTAICPTVCVRRRIVDPLGVLDHRFVLSWLDWYLPYITHFSNPRCTAHTACTHYLIFYKRYLQLLVYTHVQIQVQYSQLHWI